MAAKILHLDIETAPNLVYTWGMFKQNIAINQIVKPGYTLCVAAKWHEQKGMEFLSGWGDQKYMLERMRELLDEADIVCHYNGKKFDMPILNKEFVLAGLTPPSPYKQVDLLNTVRANFRFQSNKLDFVAQQLGLGSKTKHVGFDLWTGCMAGDSKSLKIMEKYNKQDVLLLEKLYVKLTPWLKGQPIAGLYIDSERPSCTKCGSEDINYRGYAYTSAGKYKRYVCKSCGGWSRCTASNIDKRHVGRNIT